MNLEQLIDAGKAVRERAYAPYSNFAVGAALVTESGKVFTGCNVENISFGLTNCAERSALFAAVSAGERKFSKIVIVSDSGEPVSPCGACRQALAEFNESLDVVSVNLAGRIFLAKLDELLPRAKTGILK
jgi:cytidine deaminase